ncbi:hypothetical protein LVD15_23690 [Fulvivirga maritima]|uniref:hypothetical protein n=1 Tax=Fulvivirga maritima TaxID=2904247 RepID=UPI001F36652C|nr:hypothetical protein [Fulvivirga maritima]UII26265.1 hypothetical protein LVD15_23690 [Fulvivirga maritima]
MMSMKMKGNFLFILFFVLFSSVAFSQQINTNWNSDLEEALTAFRDCENQSNDCHQYIGQSLTTVYKVNDFYSKANSEYMPVSEIHDFLSNNSSWSELGPAYSQDALQKAQDKANDKKAVVAVYLSSNGLGHVALILPGTLQPSGSWGLQVPNSASFFANEPSRSFINKGLSYAFSKSIIKDVKLYSRNY